MPIAIIDVIATIIATHAKFIGSRIPERPAALMRLSLHKGHRIWADHIAIFIQPNVRQPLVLDPLGANLIRVLANSIFKCFFVGGMWRGCFNVLRGSLLLSYRCEIGRASCRERVLRLV